MWILLGLTFNRKIIGKFVYQSIKKTYSCTAVPWRSSSDAAEDAASDEIFPVVWKQKKPHISAWLLISNANE